MKVLSAEEMANIDILAIEKYGITLLQMMELAGRARVFLSLDSSPIFLRYRAQGEILQRLSHPNHTLISIISLKKFR